MPYNSRNEGSSNIWRALGCAAAGGGVVRVPEALRAAAGRVARGDHDWRRRGRGQGMAVHVQPMKHVLKVSGTKRLNLKCDKLLSNVAFKLNLRRYSAGRQISGIILDNFSRGRKRHLWISSSTDLHRDAQRDLRDLGCHVKVINNCQAGRLLLRVLRTSTRPTLNRLLLLRASVGAFTLSHPLSCSDHGPVLVVNDLGGRSWSAP